MEYELVDNRALVRIPFLRPNPLQRYRSAAGLRQAEYEHIIFSAEPEAGTDFNLALVYGPVLPERFREIASDFFGDDPYAIAVESDMAMSFEKYLREHNWEMVEEEPAMLLEFIPDVTLPESAISIDLVTSTPQFEDFMALVPDSRRWVPELEAALDPDVALFVGYLDSEPVSTARLTCFEELGEITGITTLSSYRRRGFGTMMTCAAILEAVRRGCTRMTLTATPMGYGTYLRIGFIPVCSYRTYIFSG